MMRLSLVEQPINAVGIRCRFPLWFDADDRYISEKLADGQVWERDVLEMLLAEIRPTDTVWEIGAHIGYHTVQLACAAARVVAVEPIPHIASLLAKNIALNRLTNVELVRAALVRATDPRTTVQMRRDWQNPGASHLADEGDVVVPAARLQDLPGPCDVLKIDAEGAEHLILAGGDLSQCRVIVTEYCELQLERVSGVTGDEYLTMIEAMGFTVDLLGIRHGPEYSNIIARRRA